MPHIHRERVRVRLVATLHTLSVRGCYNLYGMLKKRNRTGNESRNRRELTSAGVLYFSSENGVTSTESEKRDGERESK